jgi:hypothetical protein
MDLVATITGSTAVNSSALTSRPIPESLVRPCFILLCSGYLIWWAGFNGFYHLLDLSSGGDGGETATDSSGPSRAPSLANFLLTSPKIQVYYRGQVTTATRAGLHANIRTDS